MPGLYSLAVHEALRTVHIRLFDAEAVFAYLDDIVALPERIQELYSAVEDALWKNARVQLNSIAVKPTRSSAPHAGAAW